MSNHDSLLLKSHQMILDLLDDGVLLSDADGKIVIYNRAAGEIEGLIPTDVLGHTLDEIYVSNATEGSEHKRVLETRIPVLNQYRAFALSKRMGKYIRYSTFPVIVDGKAVGALTLSKNEHRIQELLAETIALKRKLAKSARDAQGDRPESNGTTYHFTDIVGTSDKTEKLIREAEMMALVDSNLLIVGETGTGKEVFAQSIHNYSKNRKDPFIAINCSAIPENLLESIVFGTQKGAFTGAVDTSGLLEDAGYGTLFLDELNSMPIGMQAKLLRVIQEKKANRVGASKLYPVNCRIISAMNENPKQLMQDGRLRRDLYYRISSIILYIPALRERPDDILPLAAHFVEKYNSTFGKTIQTLETPLIDLLLKHNWPGNVRELEYVIENLMIRAQSPSALSLNDIPHHMHSDFSLWDEAGTACPSTSPLYCQLNALEKTLIEAALDETHCNLSQTARKLGIARQSLKCKIKRLQIKL